MNIFAEIIHTIENDELVSPKEYKRMLRAVLELPREFRTDVEAKDWVLLNPIGTAHVIEKRTIVASYFGVKANK